jgi:dTDP-4-dehydrorhamnose reductase
MKILITGGSGLLGQYLNIFLSKDNDILTVYNNNAGNCLNFNNAKLDITNFVAVSDLLGKYRPDAVVHCAGFTRPEACNADNKKEVYLSNVEAVKYLAELCDRFNSKLIFTSTDLVYDGNEGSMLEEDSKLNPVTMYAETKLQAEEMIKNTFDNYIILRTSLLIGLGLNHAKTNFHLMYKNLKEGISPKLFSDQYRTPFSLINASEIICGLVKPEIKNITFNFGGKDRVSRVELGEIVCRIAGFDKSLIDRISMFDIQGFPAVRDVSLNTKKLQSYGFYIKSIDEAISEILDSKDKYK